MVRSSRTIACATLVVFIAGLGFPPGNQVYAKPKNDQKGLPFLAVAGFRTLETPSESFFRAELMAELNKSRKVKPVPELVTRQIINDLWTEDRNTSKKLITDAATHFNDGKKYYSQLQMEDAINSFNKSVIAYREGIGALRDNRYLLISHLYLGMSLMVVGRKREGENFIREMIVLDNNRSNRKLSRTEFPPDVVLVHHNLTKQVLNSPMGTVIIDFKPEQANVYIDAVIQEGKLKISRDLPVGEHFIAVEKKGFRQYSNRILVKPGINNIEVDLEEWQLLSPYPFEKRGNSLATEDLSKLSSDLSANIVVLGAITQSGPGKSIISAQLFEASSKEFSRIEKMEVANSDIQSSGRKVAKRLLENLTRSSHVIAEVKKGGDQLKTNILRRNNSVEKNDDTSSLALHKKWWFWTAIGVVAVGAAGFLLLKKSDPDFNVVSIDNPL